MTKTFHTSPGVGGDADASLEVVGLGSMVLDRIHRTRRILGPDEKGLLDGVDGQGPVKICIGGVLLNQLGWASLFGLRSGLFGRQADDDAGRTLRAAMETSGIATHLDLSGTSSSLAEIFVDHAGERAIYMAAGATAETTPAHIEKDHADFIARGARLTTEVSQVPLDTTLAALRIAHARGLSTVVDLDVLPSDATATLGDRETLDALLGEADLLKPTAEAARELMPECETLEELTEAIRARYASEIVCLTDAARGVLLCDASGTRWVAAYDVAGIVDSTGAGDAFMGGLLAGQAMGLGLEDAARLGNACGAACVEQVGAFPDSSASLRGRIIERYDGAIPDDERFG